jgi:hypothetical protein
MPAQPVVSVAVSVFALQGLLMAVDEFGFHPRREMPRWERIGHPLDTLTVLLPLVLAILIPSTPVWMILFTAMAVFSCLFVTKDEWMHARYCGPREHWLHALLFLLHPVIFLAMFLLWRAGETGWIGVQAALVSVFLAWQILYWNGPWAPSLPAKHR